jgi:hypothetical protein
LQAWLSATGIRKGPLLIRIDRHRRMLLGRRLTGEGIAIVVKRAALRAGLDPAGYGGHSLRAGLATSAAIAGASYAEIKKQTGHKSDRVLERYIRDADLSAHTRPSTATIKDTRVLIHCPHDAEVVRVATRRRRTQEDRERGHRCRGVCYLLRADQGEETRPSCSATTPLPPSIRAPRRRLTRHTSLAPLAPQG